MGTYRRLVVTHPEHNPIADLSCPSCGSTYHVVCVPDEDTEALESNMILAYKEAYLKATPNLLHVLEDSVGDISDEYREWVLKLGELRGEIHDTYGVSLGGDN